MDSPAGAGSYDNPGVGAHPMRDEIRHIRCWSRMRSAPAGITIPGRSRPGGASAPAACCPVPHNLSRPALSRNRQARARRVNFFLQDKSL